MSPAVDFLRLLEIGSELIFSAAPASVRSAFSPEHRTARLGRYFIADQPLHVIQRGNNLQRIFFTDEDYTRYRDWLREAAARYGCAVHAHVLMTNHVHLLVTPQAAETLKAGGKRFKR